MNYTEIDLSETSGHEEVSTNPLKKLKSNNSDIIDKKVIEKLITEKSQRLKLVPIKGRSDIWNKFDRIFVDEKISAFVKCKSCIICYKYETNYSTSTLMKHKCSNDLDDRTQSNLEKFVTKTVLAHLKKSVAEAAALCCAIDMRPFNLINGEGFQYLAKSLIKVGAECGKNVKISDVIPSRFTVSRNVDINYKLIFEKVKNELSKIDYFGATADHWVHDALKINYFTFTLQYLLNGKLKARVLATREVINKTAVTTLSTVKEILEEFNVSFNNIIFVSDNASAMISAFKELDWFGCSSHNLNLVQKHSFDGILENEDLKPVSDLLVHSKDLVTLSKQAGFQRYFNEKTLKQMVEVRWDSRVDMLESIHENYAELRRMSLEKEKIEAHMMYIKEPLLTNLINLLKPLKKARVELCSESSPTLHLVLPTKVHLLKTLKYQNSDDIAIKILKERISTAINDYFIITKYHKCATLLTPAVKSLKNLLNDNEIKDLHKFLIELMKDVIIENETIETSQDTSYKHNNVLSFFAESASESVQKKFESPKMELKRYLNLDVWIDDPILFWHQNRQKFPRLSIIAKRLFSVPATNLSSERNFNYAGLTLTDRRSQLDPENVDKLLFIRSNCDLIKF
jgi:hypothetical protein